MEAETDSNSDYIRGFLRLMAIGFPLMVGFIFLQDYLRSKEYPRLRFNDALVNERILSFKINRGASHVEFESGHKRTLSWGQNLNYEDFPSIVSVLAIGDVVIKKANSDTIVIRHLDKEYSYVLEHAIEKSK